MNQQFKGVYLNPNPKEIAPRKSASNLKSLSLDFFVENGASTPHIFKCATASNEKIA